jgi:pimeloyl-ACP methyl ester carboxylesterase
MPAIDIGVRLECLEHGSGEPLVFVHGSASDHRTWGAQLDAFGARWRTIAYSRRHHWPNAPIADGAAYAMEEHCADLAALLRTLDAAPAHLVGHSYGAYLCLLLAIREPAFVRTLVLEEPPVLPLFVSVPPRPTELFKLLGRRPRTALAIMKFGARGLAPAAKAIERGDTEGAIRLFGCAVLGKDAFDRLTPERREQVRANFFEAELRDPGFAPLAAAGLRGVRAPTLLVTGEHSPRLFHRLTDRLHELLPHARRVVIPGASHIAHEDNTAAFDAAVRAHLREAAGRGPQWTSR